jgi:outer membrane protein assembly factor BamB
MNYAEIEINDKGLDYWFNYISEHPCKQDEYMERKEFLQRLIQTCQRLGLDTSDLSSVYDRIKVGNETRDIRMMTEAIDTGFPIVEKILKKAEKFPLFDSEEKEQLKQSSSRHTPLLRDWPCYGGDVTHKASSPDPGPQQGKVLWKAPLGYAWYSKPLIYGDKVICASPGIFCCGFIYDLKSGQILNRIERLFEREGWDDYKNNLTGSPYVHSAASSTPLLIDGEVAFNQLGAQGFSSGEKDIFFVDPEEGEITRAIPAGELDYRVGHASFTGNSQYIIYPDSTQRLIEEPPRIIGHNRITCRDTISGKKLWNFYTGPLDTEPVLYDNKIYIGNSTGMFYALDCDNKLSSINSVNEMDHISDENIVKYQINLDGPVRSSVEIVGDKLLVATCNGSLYQLDRETGALVWKKKICEPTTGAYKQFSAPISGEGVCAVSSADSFCYIISLENGEILKRMEMPDWGRSAPLIFGDKLIATSLDGTISAFSISEGTLQWRIRPLESMILADPAIDEGGTTLLVTYADLSLFAINPENGEILWDQFLMDYTMVQGRRILTDSTASGGFFQSKPTVAQERVFAGSPSRFLTSYNYKSGEALWRYEVGAAISCAPAIGEGKVVFGQQGGEDYFYCVDMITGELLWKQSLGWIWSSAAIVDGKVFIPGCDGYVSCLDLHTGAILWRFRTGRASHPEPPVEDGIVIFGSWDHYIYALDVETGEQKWSFYTGGAPDSGAPLIAEGQVFLPSIGENYYILDLYTGVVLRRFHLKNGCYNASSSYREKNLYLSESYRFGATPMASRIVCMDNFSGEIRWKLMGGGGLTAPVTTNEYLYSASTSNPFFYCINLTGENEGKEHWKVAMGDRVDESVPAIYGEKAYIVSADGYLYCFE